MFFFHLQKYWDVALGPLKQLPMNLFIMYMSGNSISIFPIMMVGMMVWRPIQALLAIKTSKYNVCIFNFEVSLKVIEIIVTLDPSGWS